MSLSGKWSPEVNALTTLGFKGYVGNSVQTKQDVVIIPIGETKGAISALLKFSALSDKFEEIMRFDPPLPCKSVSICIDKQNDKIYAPHKNGCYIIDLINKTFKEDMSHLKGAKYSWSGDATSVYIHPKLHVFGHIANHVSYNYETGYFQSNEDLMLLPPPHRFSSQSMVHIPSKNKLLFFGEGMEEHIVSYDVTTGKYRILDYVTLPTKNAYHPGVLLTKDEKYVLIFIGFSDDDFGYEFVMGEPRFWTKKTECAIMVLDTETNVLYSSVCAFPRSDVRSTQAFLVDNEKLNSMIINGYIRQYWKQDPRSIPVDLIDILLMYYEEAEVHLVERETGQHWKIPLHDILQFQ